MGYTEFPAVEGERIVSITPDEARGCPECGLVGLPHIKTCTSQYNATPAEARGPEPFRGCPPGECTHCDRDRAALPATLPDADEAWKAYEEDLVTEAVEEMPRIPDIAAITARHRPLIEAAILHDAREREGADEARGPLEPAIYWQSALSQAIAEVFAYADPTHVKPWALAKLLNDRLATRGVVIAVDAASRDRWTNPRVAQENDRDR